MTITNFNGGGVGFGFRVGCGFGVGWGFGGVPLNIFGLGAGGGYGVGLGLGWGFGAAYGSRYYSLGLTFQGIEFESKSEGKDSKNFVKEQLEHLLLQAVYHAAFHHVMEMYDFVGVDW